jgi:hypothetical protein
MNSSSKTNFFAALFCESCDGTNSNCPTCKGCGWYIVLETQCKTTEEVEEKHEKLGDNFYLCCHAEYVLNPRNKSNWVNAIKENFTEDEINNAIDWNWVRDNPIQENRETFNRVRKTKHLEYFIERILELSEADTWEEAKLEWKLDRIDFTTKEKGESCLCGKTPICELCQITNSLNGNSTQVGNVCIDKFTDLPSNLIFTNIKKVLEDIDKSFNEATIEYIYERGWINEWECGFLINTKRKRKLTNKQYNKRVSINRKILRKFNIEGNYVSQGEEKTDES